MKEISQRHLRNDSGEIMRGLDEGESYVVTRNGTPLGELTPLRRHRFVSTETALAMFRGAPPADYRSLRRDLDAVASASLGRKAPGARAVDLLIAATAAAADLPLYTRNVDDFRGLEDVVTAVEV